jgi:hypothetical protein
LAVLHEIFVAGPSLSADAVEAVDPGWLRLKAFNGPASCRTEIAAEICLLRREQLSDTLGPSPAHGPAT